MASHRTIRKILSVVAFAILLCIPLAISNAEDSFSEKTSHTLVSDGSSYIGNEIARIYNEQTESVTEGEGSYVTDITIDRNENTAAVAYSAKESGTIHICVFTDYEENEANKKLIWKSENVRVSEGEGTLTVDISEADLPEYFVLEGNCTTESGSSNYSEFYTYTRDYEFLENATEKDFAPGYYVAVDTRKDSKSSESTPKLAKNAAAKSAELEEESYTTGFLAYNKDLLILDKNTEISDAGTEENPIVVFENVPNELEGKTEEELNEIVGFVIPGDSYENDTFILNDGIQLTETGAEVSVRKPESIHELYDAVSLKSTSKGSSEPKVSVNTDFCTGWVSYTKDVTCNFQCGAIYAIINIGFGNYGHFSLNITKATFSGDTTIDQNPSSRKEIPISIPNVDLGFYGVGLETKSKIYVAANNPVIIEGEYGSGVMLDARIGTEGTGFTPKWKHNSVTFTKVEPTKPNVKTYVYFCRKSDFSTELGVLKVNLLITKFKIGPVFTMTSSISCIGKAVAYLEKDVNVTGDPDILHACSVSGEKGCIQGQTRSYDETSLRFRLNVKVYDKTFTVKNSTSDYKDRYFYKSLQYNEEVWSSTNITCPHMLYRISVKTTENGNPIENALIKGKNIDTKASDCTTGADGVTKKIYLPLKSYNEIIAEDAYGDRIGAVDVHESKLLNHSTIYIDRSTINVTEVDLNSSAFRSTFDGEYGITTNAFKVNRPEYDNANLTFLNSIVRIEEDADRHDWRTYYKLSATWEGICPDGIYQLVPTHDGIMHATFVIDYSDTDKNRDILNLVRISKDVNVKICGQNSGGHVKLNDPELDSRFIIKSIEISDGVSSGGVERTDAVLTINADFYINDSLDDDYVLVTADNGLNATSSRFYKRGTTAVVIGKDVESQRNSLIELADSLSSDSWYDQAKTVLKEEIKYTPEISKRFSHWKLDPVANNALVYPKDFYPVITDDGILSYNAVTFKVPTDKSVQEIHLTANYAEDESALIDKVYVEMNVPKPGDFLTADDPVLANIYTDPGKEKTPKYSRVQGIENEESGKVKLHWSIDNEKTGGIVRYNTTYFATVSVRPIEDENHYAFKYPLSTENGTNAYFILNNDEDHPQKATSFHLVNTLDSPEFPTTKPYVQISYAITTPKAKLFSIFPQSDLWYPEGVQCEVINADLKLLDVGILAEDPSYTETTVQWNTVKNTDIPGPGGSFTVKGIADVPEDLDCDDTSVLNTEVTIHIYGADEVEPPTAYPSGGVFQKDLEVILATQTMGADIKYEVKWFDGEKFIPYEDEKTYTKPIELYRAANTDSIYKIIAKSVLTDELTGITTESKTAEFNYLLQEADSEYQLLIRGGRGDTELYGNGIGFYMPALSKVKLTPYERNGMKFAYWRIVTDPDMKNITWINGTDSKSYHAEFVMPRQDTIIEAVFVPEGNVRLVSNVDIMLHEPEVGDDKLAETDLVSDFTLIQQDKDALTITIDKCENLLWDTELEDGQTVDYGDRYAMQVDYTIQNDEDDDPAYPDLISKTRAFLPEEYRFKRDETKTLDYFSPSVKVTVNTVPTENYLVSDDLNQITIFNDYEIPSQFYTLRYDANGGYLMDVPKQIIQLNNISTPLTAEKPVHPNNALFLGWSEDPNATVPEYVYSDNPLENPVFRGNDDVTTLYAVWSGYGVEVYWLDYDNLYETRNDFTLLIDGNLVSIDHTAAVERNGVGYQQLALNDVPLLPVSVCTEQDGTLRFGTKDGIETIYTVDCVADGVVTKIYLTAAIEMRVRKVWDIDYEGMDRPDSVKMILQGSKKTDIDILTRLMNYILAGDGENYQSVIRELGTEIGYNLELLSSEAIAQELSVRIEKGLFASDNIKDSLKTLLLADTNDSIEKGFYGYETLILSEYNGWNGTFPLYNRFSGTEETDKYGNPTMNWDIEQIRYRVVEKSGLAPVENGMDARFFVPAYIDIAGKEVSDHYTVYSVSYDTDGDQTVVTNLAVEDHILSKKWVLPDTATQPDDVYAFLLWRYDKEFLDAVKGHTDIGDITSLWLPETNPISGDLLSVGDLLELLKIPNIPLVDMIKIPVACAKLSEENNWSTTYRIRKYGAMGLPLEHEGAEFFSAICQDVLKYFLGIDLPIGVNPLDEFISVSVPEIQDRLTGTCFDYMVNTWIDGDVDRIHYISGAKVWNDTGDADGNRPNEITLHIYEDGSRYVGNIKVKRADNTLFDLLNFWTWVYTDDSIDTTKHIYTVTEEPIEGYAAEIDGLNVVNTYISGFERYVSLDIGKVWYEDGEHDHSPIILTVKRNGIFYKNVTLNEENDWRVRLDKCEKTDGIRAYHYSVEEVEIPTFYVASYDIWYEPLTSTWKLYVTNTRKDDSSEKVVLSGRKNWNDGNNADGIRPQEITVRIFGNGIEVAEYKLSERNGWCWNGIYDKYDADKKLIVYSIEEDAVVDYTTSYDGIYVTNTHIPSRIPPVGKMNLLLQKIWLGTDDVYKPSAVKVQLLRDGEPYGNVVTLNEDNNWQAEIKELDIEDASGNRYVYSIKETNVPNGFSESYSYSYDALRRVFYATVINTRIGDDEIKLQGSKNWEDSADKYGRRPESIRVYIIATVGASSKIVDTKLLNESTQWTWSGIYPKKDKDGNEIVYSVKEVSVPAYDATYTGNGLSVENKLTGSSLTVTKTMKHSQLPEDRTKPFPFIITLKNASGELYNGTLLATVNGVERVLTFTNGETTVSLADGGQVTIYGISDKWEYTIRETENDAYLTTVIDPENTQKSEEGYPSWTHAVKKDKTDSKADFYNETAYCVHVRWLDNDNLENTRKNFTFSYGGNIYTVNPAEAEEINGVGCQTVRVTGVKDARITVNGLDENNLIHFGVFDGISDIYEVTVSTEQNAETITLLAKRELNVEKVWDIDFEKKDRPDSVTMILQGSKKPERTDDLLTKLKDYVLYGEGDEYETVLSELETKLGKGAEALSPEAMVTTLDESIANGTFKETDISETVKGILNGNTINSPKKNMYGYESLKVSENNSWKGTFKLVDRYDGKIETDEEGNLKAEWKGAIKYRVVEKCGLKIVEDGEDATFFVPTYENLLGKQVTEHNTLYQVSYKENGDNTTVTNMAVEIHIIDKEWLLFGNAKRPDEVYVFLLWRYDQEYLEAVKGKGQAGDPTSLWLPEINPLKGETLSVGDILEIFHIKIPFADLIDTPLAGAKLNDGNEWKSEYRIKKYGQMGMPLEHEAAEFFSAVCQDVLKYFLGIDIPIGINPLDKFISISIPEIKDPLTGIAYDFVVNIWGGDDDEPKHSIGGSKVWDDDNNRDGIRPDEITLHIYEDGSTLIDTIKVTLKDNASFADKGFWVWSYKSDKIDTKKHQYSVTEDPIPGYTTEIDGLNVINRHVPESKKYVSLDIRKTWKGGNESERGPIQLTIKRNDSVYKKVTLDESNNWHVHLDKCEKVDSNGKTYKYSLEEASVPSGYTVSYEVRFVSSTNTWKLYATNSKKTEDPEKITLSGNKTWNDSGNKDGIRPPQVTVHVYGNGEEVATYKLSERNGWHWSGTFDKCDANGKEIKYTVREEGVPDYTTSYSGKNVLNQHTPTPEPPKDKMNILILKVWVGADIEHPMVPVHVQLLQNGKPYGDPVTLSWSNLWQVLVKDVPIKDSFGIPYVYSIVEDPLVDGFATAYTYSYDKTKKLLTATVINARIDGGKIVLGGNKTWVDDNDALGRRPSSITLYVIATSGGKSEIVDTKVLSAATQWTWSGVYPMKDKNGNVIKYSVKELTVPGYETKYSKDGLSVTNTVVGSTLTITNTVISGDKNKAFPYRISIRDENKEPYNGSMLAVVNGKARLLSFKDGIAYIALCHGMQGTVYGIPDNYEYKVYEEENETYVTWVIDLENTVNPHEQDTGTDTKAKKSLKATANQTALGSPKDVFPEWTRVIKGEIRDSRADFYNAQNTSITVTKIWDDNGKSSKRPVSIKVNLFQEGVLYDTATVTGSADEWTYTFTDLPTLTRDIKTISYSVTEEPVPGYETTVRGFTIYNELTPDKNTFIFYKIWKDNLLTHEDPVFILYHADGTVCRGEDQQPHHSRTDPTKYYYELGEDKEEHYVKEVHMEGYITTYANVKQSGHESVKDRCYNRGTITNSIPPKTGDTMQPELYASLLAVFGTGLGILLYRRKRRLKK